jgi:carbonic anhydrase
MRATKTGFNPELQRALDEFQQQYKKDYDECVGILNRKRRMGEVSDKEAEEILSIASELEYAGKPRMLQSNITPATNATASRKNWDPHHPLLMPSVHFFGYQGSVTEPPCGEFVSWFVLDAPMLMSFEQLNQIKRLIFSHLSPQCKRTSVHYKQSVARPIQDRGNRTVWRCTSDNWERDT